MYWETTASTPAGGLHRRDETLSQRVKEDDRVIVGGQDIFNHIWGSTFRNHAWALCDLAP